MDGSIEVSYMSSRYLYKGKQKSKITEFKGWPQTSPRKVSPTTKAANQWLRKEKAYLGKLIQQIQQKRNNKSLLHALSLLAQNAQL